MSDSLQPHESQYARPPCPSPSPRVHSNSRASSQWCHPAISSSIIPFSSCPQSLPASESFPMSQLFAWGGQSTRASAFIIPSKEYTLTYTHIYTQTYRTCGKIPRTWWPLWVVALTLTYIVQMFYFMKSGLWLWTHQEYLFLFFTWFLTQNEQVSILLSPSTWMGFMS